MSVSDATPPVKKLIVSHQTEDDTTRRATRSTVKVTNGETTDTDQPSTNGTVNTDTPTTSTSANTTTVTPHLGLTDSFNLSEFLITDPTIASLLPDTLLSILNDSPICLTLPMSTSTPLLQAPASPPPQSLDTPDNPTRLEREDPTDDHSEPEAVSCPDQPESPTPELQTTTSEDPCVTTSTSTAPAKLIDYSSSSPSVSPNDRSPPGQPLDTTVSTHTTTDNSGTTSAGHADADPPTVFNEHEIRQRINVIALLIEEILPGRGETMGELLLFQHLMAHHRLF